MPHLVLPLSGCLSRRTPARATRGEARGHRSVLAQNPLFMHLLLFSFLWTCRRCGVSSPYGGLVPMRLRCCGCIPAGLHPIALLCGHVGRRRAHSTMALALCVGCASPPGVGVDRRRVYPHRRDVGPWCTAGVNGVVTVLGTMVLRGCVCVCVTIAVVGPTMVTPDDRGGLGMRVRFGGIP